VKKEERTRRGKVHEKEKKRRDASLSFSLVDLLACFACLSRTFQGRKEGRKKGEGSHACQYIIIIPYKRSKS